MPFGPRNLRRYIGGGAVAAAAGAGVGIYQGARQLGNWAWENRNEIHDTYTRWFPGNNATVTPANSTGTNVGGYKRPRVDDITEDSKRVTKRARTDQVSSGRTSVVLNNFLGSARYRRALYLDNMPYRRKRRYRRKSGRRGYRVPRRYKGYLRTGGNYRAIRNGVYTERKEHESQYDNTLTNAYTPARNISDNTDSCISAPAGGSTDTTRVGNKFVVSSISIKADISGIPFTHYTSGTLSGVNQFVAPKPMCITAYLVLDTQTNGAAAAATDIWENGGTTYNGLNHMRLDQGNRFKILKKWDIVLTPEVDEILNVADGGGAYYVKVNVQWPCAKINYYKKCKIPVRMNTTSGGITNVKSNSLQLWATMKGGTYTDPTGASGAAGANISHVTRLRFIDL